MTTLPKGTTVDTKNLQPVELIHTQFAYYNVTSIQGFNSILNVVCENTIIIWVFTTASKRVSFIIIHFILTTPNNEKHGGTRYIYICEYVVFILFGIKSI